MSSQVAGGLQLVGKEIIKDARILEEELEKDVTAVEREVFLCALADAGG